MKIIPKSTNFKMVIEDKQIQQIIKNTPKKDLKNTIDTLTRSYLRKKYPNKPIEGLERLEEGVTQPVWYVYQLVDNCAVMLIENNERQRSVNGIAPFAAVTVI